MKGLDWSSLTERLNIINFSFEDIKRQMSKLSENGQIEYLQELINNRFKKQKVPVSAQQAYQNVLFMQQIETNFHNILNKLLNNGNVYAILPPKMLQRNDGKKLIIKQCYSLDPDDVLGSRTNKKVNTGYGDFQTDYIEYLNINADATAIRHEDNHIINGDLEKEAHSRKNRYYKGEGRNKVELNWHDADHKYGQWRESHADTDRPNDPINKFKAVGNDVISNRQNLIDIPEMKYVEPTRYYNNRYQVRHNRDERKTKRLSKKDIENIRKQAKENRSDYYALENKGLTKIPKDIDDYIIHNKDDATALVLSNNNLTTLNNCPLVDYLHVVNNPIPVIEIVKYLRFAIKNDINVTIKYSADKIFYTYDGNVMCNYGEDRSYLVTIDDNGQAKYTRY